MVLDSVLPSLIDPIKQSVVHPIRRIIIYVYKCDSMVQILQEQVEQLKKKKDRLPPASEWPSGADEAIREAEELVQHKEEGEKKKWCFGFCPNLNARYQLGKSAHKRALAIQLYNEGIPDFSYCPPLPTIAVPCMHRSKLLPSRVVMANRITDALRDPGLNVIGIYGVAGVGKTTLAKEVCAQARDEELFDDVVVISVSQFPNLRRIQAEIAGSLGLILDSEEVPRRAGQLCQRLKKGKSLVILDDVWRKLDLHAVGVPCGDEGQGCKLLIASRSKDVLSTEMGSQKDFLVDVLSREEGWSLFQTIAPEIEDPRLNAVAIEIAKRCAELPLLIVLVSIQLRHGAVNAWVNMLKLLSECSSNDDLPGRVSKVVESSFWNMHGEGLRSLFLLCASSALSNIQIRHLLIHGMGLRLFGNITTIRDARLRLFRSITALKYNYLLLDGDLDEHVKLHDMVRDAAVSIASRFQNSFIDANETRLTNWPHRDCTRISLRICTIEDLPASLHCPMAELFLLSSEDLCLDIPDSFFEGLAKLKVVEFTGICFMTRLPFSLGCLRDLDTLCLHRCHLDNVSVIGELTELKFLSFADSDISELPREIEALSQLKLLDLTNCSRLQVIPINVVSKLISLEELYMRYTDVQWDEEGNASLLELGLLSYLSSLEIQVVNPKLVPKFSSFCNRLRHYKIVIGKEHGWENSERQRMLKLIKLKASFYSEDGFQVLLKATEHLHLDEVRGMHIDGEALAQLRHLCIKNDNRIQHLVKSRKGSSCHAFGKLESLRVDNLKSLEMICDGILETGSFGELRILKVTNCSKIKSLFSYSSLRLLSQLQEIEVESCENMESVLSDGSEDIRFPILSSLKLKNLPHLKGFCNKKGRAEKTGLLFHDKITFSNLTSLEVKKCRSLKYVLTRSNTKLLLPLNRLEINNCELMEEIIWSKGSEGVKEKGIDKNVLHSLKYVLLKKLKHLKRFSSGSPFQLSSLTKLSIYECPAMEYFLPEVSEKTTSCGTREYLCNLDGKTFPQLTLLHVWIGNGIQHNFNLNALNLLEWLHFDELRSLNARNCNKLKDLFKFSNAKCYTRLLELEVQSCRNVEAIIGGRSEDKTLEFTRLRSLKLENLPLLMGFGERKEGTGQSELLFNRMVSFPNLTSLVVKKCNNLKYVFTTAMVKCLVQLKQLEISNCELIEAIIQSNKTGEREDGIISTVVFCKLDSLLLYGLPNVKMFGYGNQIDFPSLRELSIECPSMANFVSKFSDRNDYYNGDEYLFNDMVTFPNLETMVVKNMNTFRFLWHEKSVLDGLLSKLKSLDIANCSRISVVFPENMFRRFQELETLHLSSCDGIEEIFQFVETEFREINIAEEFPLRDVQIVNLASLKHVFSNTIANSLIKLEQLEIHKCNVQVIVEDAKDTILQGITCSRDQRPGLLQEMEVYSNDGVIQFPQLYILKRNLPHLTGFCNKRELGFGLRVSFPSLKGLELCECNNFKYVFTTAMVNSFVQLEKLEIDKCELLEDIILSREFDGIDVIESIEKIVFPKLEYLSIEKLPNLKTFHFGYPVEFQLLKELHIFYCPVLKNFVSKYLVNESDEYLFNEMVTFSNLETMKLYHTNGFEYLWDGRSTADDSFLKLKSLTIEYCSTLSVVFTSKICRRFQGIEKLHLCCCSRVEEIYRFEGEISEGPNTVEAFSLQDLEICNLPSLKYIWSTDPPGAFTFSYLQSVKVLSCNDLKFVFPKSIARRLLQLQLLKIGDSYMEVIIANTNVEKSEFLFPQLSILQLENLYQMRNLYEGPYTFECSKLKLFDIYGCDQAMNFYSEIRSLQQSGFDHKETSPSLVRKKFIHNLEELTLDDQGLKLLLCVDLGVGFSKLKKLTLRSLEEESVPLLVGFLRRCSLDKLAVVESYLEEIFVLDDGEGFSNHLTLKHLEIVGDDNVKHMLKKDSRFKPILENLLTLNIEFCESLINIAPSSASFGNLTSLNISVCFKMMNLVTASTARTMKNLMELKVSECIMMEDIVESDEIQDSWITFDKLKCIELYDLPILNSFCPSKLNFSFPSLDRVSVKKCFAMRNFCRGLVEAPKLQAIHFQDEQHWKGDLNATIVTFTASSKEY